MTEVKSKSKVDFIRDVFLNEQHAREIAWTSIVIEMKRNKDLYDHHLPDLIYTFEKNETDEDIINSDDMTRVSRIKINDKNIGLAFKKNGLICSYLIDNFPSFKDLYFKLACRYGLVYFVYLLIDRYRFDWNTGLYNACLGGHLGIARLMIEKGAYHMNHAMYYACEGGCMDVVDLLIENGASDWNNGLLGASSGGNIEIFRRMISYGADNLNRALYHACRNNHIHIVRELIMLDADDGNLGLREACYNGNLEIVRLMIAKSTKRCDNCGKMPAEH